MVKRLGLVILLLVLSVPSLGIRDTPPTGETATPSPRPAIGPLDVVTASVARGLASLHAQRVGFNAGEDRRAEMRRAAHELFDVKEMSRRALGQHWKGLLPREQAEFARLFGDVLTQSFVTILERYRRDGVASLEERVAGRFARVRSRITARQESEIAIEYRLSQSGSQWAVYDIVLGGVSLVSNYRSQFNSVIGTSSAARLLERMRAEPSPGPQLHQAVGGATTTAELETSARGRAAAGLLLGAAFSSRWR